ncbi:hypothetical protein RB195_000413 [Necator americanus]|uniref:Tyrosine specific protein phosphatases domain-containing protein n=1 Tax=Necator americanus TaxID=51031 RepID=A0ABR1DBA1_NECAM
MARPQMVHFENDVIIDHFKKCNIVAVFNLEEIGEHAHCGKGNLVNGFSYDPELFMENDIFHYNFPLPDFEACVADHMVDIVTVMVHELIRGNIAVHCHAGHGRTGTAIAACLMRTQGLTPREAVELVRSKRPSSVQSGEQVRALHSLHNFLRNSVTILPAHPFPSMLLYIEYTSRVLPKLDMRKFGNVPKPLFVGVIALLHKCFTSVTFKLEVTPNQFHCFRFKCNEPTSFRITEETLSLMNVDVTIRGQSWYADRVRRGMNILNLENFLEDDCDIVEVVSFIDYFFVSSFFQLTTAEELTSFLTKPSRTVTNWSWSLCLMLSAFSSLPQQLHPQLSKLIAKWFGRCKGDTWMTVYSWLKHRRSDQKEYGENCNS